MPIFTVINLTNELAQKLENLSQRAIEIDKSLVEIKTNIQHLPSKEYIDESVAKATKQTDDKWKWRITFGMALIVVSLGVMNYFK